MLFIFCALTLDKCCNLRRTLGLDLLLFTWVFGHSRVRVRFLALREGTDPPASYTIFSIAMLRVC